MTTRHYKAICITMYTRDLRQLDRMVEKLKMRGVARASRSSLIRFALDGVELLDVPDDLGSEQDDARRGE